MVIGRLKQLRDSRHLSQQKLADALQVAQATVASWEVGRTEPSHSALNAIAAYFNVSVDYLLGNEVVRTEKFSDDETKLIDDYRWLDEDGKNLVLGIISRLRGINSPKSSKVTVKQNSENGSNFGIVGGNFNSSVTLK